MNVINPSLGGGGAAGGGTAGAGGAGVEGDISFDDAVVVEGESEDDSDGEDKPVLSSEGHASRKSVGGSGGGTSESHLLARRPSVPSIDSDRRASDVSFDGTWEGSSAGGSGSVSYPGSVSGGGGGGGFTAGAGSGFGSDSEHVPVSHTPRGGPLAAPLQETKKKSEQAGLNLSSKLRLYVVNRNVEFKVPFSLLPHAHTVRPSL